MMVMIVMIIMMVMIAMMVMIVMIVMMLIFKVVKTDVGNDNNDDAGDGNKEDAPCKESSGKVKVKEVKSGESDNEEKNKVEGETETVEESVALRRIMMVIKSPSSV